MPIRKRVWLGVATFWPIFYLLVFVIVPPTRHFFVAHGWHLPGHSFTLMSVAALLVQLLTVLGVGLVSLYFELHLARARHVPDEERLPWMILLVLISVLAAPVYWYLYVWRDVERVSPAALAPPRG